VPLRLPIGCRKIRAISEAAEGSNPAVISKAQALFLKYGIDRRRNLVVARADYSLAKESARRYSRTGIRSSSPI